ncbi:MAG TPA: hypothetical protein VFM46_02490 [Pseudomonadales bacterium]|nr:hypothetical protein [Pseudomonadales bacterium]
MNDIMQKNLRISEADIADAAAEAVSRALASREASLRELNSAEVSEVSGGAALLKSPIIYGGFLLDALKTANTGGISAPTLNTLNTSTLAG